MENSQNHCPYREVLYKGALNIWVPGINFIDLDVSPVSGFYAHFIRKQ